MLLPRTEVTGISHADYSHCIFRRPGLLFWKSVYCTLSPSILSAFSGRGERIWLQSKGDRKQCPINFLQGGKLAFHASITQSKARKAVQVGFRAHFPRIGSSGETDEKPQTNIKYSSPRTNNSNLSLNVSVIWLMMPSRHSSRIYKMKQEKGDVTIASPRSHLLHG